MNSAIELKEEFATVSHAVRFDGDDGLDEQRRALQALISRCGNRGLQGAVKQEKRHIDAMEQEYSASAPGIYSASVSGVRGRGDRFRHGEFRGQAYMTVQDFAAYYSQCRQSKPAARGERTATKTVTAKDCTDSGVILCSVPAENSAQKADQNTQKSARVLPMVARVERVAREWFEPDDRVLRREKGRKAFPYSMVASFLIVAVSLMMLISGSVMVAGAKSEVSELRREVAQLSDEAVLLENRLESQIDYLEIYRLATQEYGMVDADFVRGTYLGADADNYIEVYEEEEDATAGLATILAAIGIHIGE